MKSITLGNTGIEVTELCFGALPIGPMQKNVPADLAAETIAFALEKGVNFIDTAQTYKTYPHIRKAIEKTGIRPVLASKSPAETYEDMTRAVDEALESLGTEYIDIFLLHAARTGTDVFEKRAGALRCLMDCREKGLIRATGISTHDAVVTAMAAEQKDIDVVFPIINMAGMGILNGGREDMEKAIEKCFENGKGIYLMKALAGGKLIADYEQAMAYARGIFEGRAPIAMGMVNNAEVEMNIAYFSGEDVTDTLARLEIPKKEFFILKGLCIGCGKCVDACHSGAVTLLEGKGTINGEKCLTCGYCVDVCPQFAIRMI